MKRFIAFACLFIAAAHCASLSNEENLKDIGNVKENIKNAENILALLRSQINRQAAEDPNLRNDHSELQKLREVIVRANSQLHDMNKLTRVLERQFSPITTQRRRRNVEERQNVVVETTQTVVNSAAVGIQSTLNTLNNLMININRGVNNIFNRLTNQITNVAVSANNAAQSGVQTLNNGAQTAISNVNSAVTGVANTVYTGVSGAAQGVGTAIQTGYQAVSTAAQSGINAAANTVNRLTG